LSPKRRKKSLKSKKSKKLKIRLTLANLRLLRLRKKKATNFRRVIRCTPTIEVRLSMALNSIPAMTVESLYHLLLARVKSSSAGTRVLLD